VFVDRASVLIAGMRRARIVVVGDLIADQFISGEVSRMSREAPVLILKYDNTTIVPGGAGNAAANVAALGARVDVVGLVGRDDEGRRLLKALPRGANLRGVIRAAGYTTPVKTRILAGGVHSAKQQIVRIDKTGAPVTDALRARVQAALTRAVRGADAIIVSDYGSGVINATMVRKALSRAGRKKPLVLVDSRYAMLSFAGMTATTPNESEVEAQLGMAIGDDVRALERAGRALLKKTRATSVLITRGSRGMALFEAGQRPVHIPIVGSDEVADVTGAGDTVIATFALALAAGASSREAAHLANHAGGIVVMKRGTATVTRVELASSVSAYGDAERVFGAVGE
jgi:rfaE bifunctional protein kinase chain/domain